MKHSSSRDAANRHGNGATRHAFQKADDTTPLQESKVNGYHEEEMDKVEHVMPHGFTSVPLPPTGSGDDAQTAESIMIYMGSNRSHGIVVVTDDRRYRLNKLKDGEIALYDDIGHQIHFTRDGIVVSVPQGKKIVQQVMDDEKMPQD